ncbi:MAG: hypothetical protein H6843_15720 [Rhodospirillaceae bacterium]|nr:hypothetical protein [Rhodospirillaceae bacterium]
MVDPWLFEPYKPIPAFKRSLRLVLRRPSVLAVFLVANLIPAGLVYAFGLDVVVEQLADIADNPSSVVPGDLAEYLQSAEFWHPMLVIIGVLVLANALSVWIAIYAYTLDGVGYAASYAKVVGGVVRVLPSLVGVSILSVLAVLLGGMLLIVPGVIAMLVLWLVVPCVLVERVGPITALGRSAELTRGNRGSILLVMILQWIVSLVASIVLSVLFFPAVTGQMGNPGTGTSGLMLVGNIVSVVLQLCFTAWLCAAVAYTYGHLRVLKEGPP